MENKDKKTNKKSDNISVEGNDIKLSEKGITMFARLDTRRQNKKGEYPIRIRLIHNRVVRDYGTRLNATEQEYKKIIGERPKATFADKKIIIIALLNRAFDIVISIKLFTFSNFNDVYLNKQNNDNSNIYNWYADKIKQLKKNGQLGTALTYECSRDSLNNFKTSNKFKNSDVLRFSDVNVQFIKKYEKWMYQNEKSPTTVGIYLRPLRHIFNLAMDQDINIVPDYPFKRNEREKNKYVIPKANNIKKALSEEDVHKIINYKSLTGSSEAFYKDIWIFSYFANGMNMKDICRLKYKNIDGDMMEFRRAKTIRTKNNDKPILVYLIDDLNRIIEEYGTKPKRKNNYIFNFLQPGMSDEKEMAAIKQLTKQVNKYIKRIAKDLQIDKNISSYTARHSWVTISIENGAPLSYIQEGVGHSQLSTTQNYINTTTSGQHKKYAEMMSSKQNKT